jgi:K+-sensing histidine kinase KdpD
MVNFGISGDAIANFDTRLLSIAIKNVLTNSLNHVDHKNSIPYIHVTVVDYLKQIHLIIEDNGKGIDPEHVDSLFKLFSVGHLSNEKPTGVGLYTARTALERFGASIELAKHASPTTFIIRIHKDYSEININFPFTEKQETGI